MCAKTESAGNSGNKRADVANGLYQACFNIVSLEVCSRVYLWSDLHTDQEENWTRVRALGDVPPGSCLLLPGDVATRLTRLRETLEYLATRFAHIVYVPGNHELWIVREDGVTSMDKSRERALCFISI